MNIYVASKFENAGAVRKAHRVLRAAGHVITHDWTGEDLSLAQAHGMSVDEYKAQCADADYRGAASADVVLLLADYDAKLGKMQGGMFEAGVGAAHGALVFCVTGKEVSIFDHLSTWQNFPNIDEAFDAIKVIEKQRRQACRE